MSKIVDALRKLQDERIEDGSEGPRKHRKIARIEQNNANGTDQLDDSVVGPTASQRSSRIVTIDAGAMREAGLIAPEAETKLFEDEYRVIKRPILSNAFGRNSDTVERGYVVLVTSAIAGDGKTFTCINLALSLAREQDTSVLLIDADVPKPHISSLFDAQDEIGLVDYLDGSTSDMADIELQTNVDGLTIVPAGKSGENSSELLSSDRMLKMLEDVHRRDPRRIILIDSSPLLLTSESRAIASVAGQVALVVRAGITPKGAVSDAIATLDTGKPTNLILNQVRFGSRSSYYSGYYGGYGSAYGGT
jgi:protein-tyrosine kinase